MAKYTYPHCPECDTVEDWFGIRLPDPYAWLRDGKDPRVLDFVARENACTDAFFPAEDLRVMIAELKARAVKPLPTGISMTICSRIIPMAFFRLRKPVMALRH